MEEQIQHDRRAIEMYRSKVSDQCLTISKSGIQKDNIKSIQFVDELPVNELKLICLPDIRFDRVPTKLTKLHFIACEQANFTGLEQMSQLTFLRIFSNMSLLKHVNFISTLVNLTILDLSSNRIKDLSPLENLIELQEINLSFNTIEDISPLRKLVKTELLDLQSNNIVDINPLKYLKELKELNLQNNLLFTIKPIWFLEKLTVCDVTQNMILDQSLPKIHYSEENEFIIDTHFEKVRQEEPSQQQQTKQYSLTFQYLFIDLLEEEEYSQLKPTKQQQLFSNKIKTVYEQQEQLQQEQNLIKTAKLHITQKQAQALQILSIAEQSHEHWTHNIVRLFQNNIMNDVFE
ncbi:leucine-rich_repeat domain-containing protein [Hexamita inflata]|uniref:Leucine-rich_repeat domain-containing protein n=1 Tax=Hexamita inflata TaxID=28002 RepID=A0ABP1GEC1_9EUKA